MGIILTDVGSNLRIKGLREGLLITLDGSTWHDQHQKLVSELKDQADFLRGARLAIDVGGAVLKAADLGQLTKELSDFEITLWAVLSESPTTESSARSFGLATRLPKPGGERQTSAESDGLQPQEPAVLVRRTLRSGFNLQHHGHVVVIGDINPGAQVIASGDIVVWGKLRGMVHAGAEGNENAIICALDLSPTQLRIAGAIAVTPKRRGKPQPEMARLNNGQVVADVWDPKKEKL